VTEAKVVSARALDVREAYPPLPVPKSVRVWAEMIRTGCAVAALLVNVTVLVVVLR